MEKPLPAIPPKRYFTIGEVSELCGVKPYVLRYWEQEFGQLRPMKRRGNRRYYQHHEVLLIRRIRELLYEQGFTISGARNRLGDVLAATTRDADVAAVEEGADRISSAEEAAAPVPAGLPLRAAHGGHAMPAMAAGVDGGVAELSVRPRTEPWSMDQVRSELLSIRGLLSG
ncbi:MerR family transcriptional regulator [Aquabacterium sp. J223]|uniref:MerR family transcriptional regulator n=1 Tax=Aquabacterium sp. J223 TaxID=2898431 RepID=UPI0021AD5284|nr:MerR family transcriptional regulator [Aquabacterium sp. J223]UUX97279.1 MerR family transcriptional regulator [Aquabacterium sp. J223]